jgi:hypothetical protein
MKPLLLNGLKLTDRENLMPGPIERPNRLTKAQENRIKRNIESKAAETSRLMAATPEQVAKHVAEAKRLMAEARLKNTGMRGAGGSGLDFRDANK